jgi:4-azaleucine resistance transporter AzlC
MSAFVFAGSAQFIAAGLVASGTSTALIILTTFVVNLRHSLYSASLAPHMKHLPQRWLLPLGFWLTDESYVVVINRYNQPDTSPYKHWFFFGSALSMYLNWQLCTYIGIRAGQTIHDPQRWGLDFALAVTFLGMLVPMLRNRPILICVLVAGISSVLFYGLPNKLGLIVAALLAVGAGVVAERWAE